MMWHITYSERCSDRWYTSRSNCIYSAQGTFSCYSFIGAGQWNTVESCNAGIVTGCCNTVAGNCAMVGAGFNNVISSCGCFSVVGGGFCNFLDKSHGFIGSGVCNQITSSGYFSVIGGGECNVALGSNSFIGGGCNNWICQVTVGLGSDRSVIGGGMNNCITDCGSLDSWDSVISGGCDNIICAAHASFIGGGHGNCTMFGSSTIVGGDGNCVFACRSFIGGGQYNKIVGTDDLSILGGTANVINGLSKFSSIGGGCSNNILGPAWFGVIAGGGQNQIGNSSTSPNNTHFNTVSGGYLNCIDDSASFNSIVGGSTNFIGCAAACNFIGGGYNNMICSTVAKPTNDSFVLGGTNHVVCAGANYGGVFGGNQNTVSGLYSSVFGGCASCDNGKDYAGVFGKGVIAQAPNTFHVECLNACNTPCNTSPWPKGTIFACNPGSTLPLNAMPLFIQF